MTANIWQLMAPQQSKRRPGKTSSRKKLSRINLPDFIPYKDGWRIKPQLINELSDNADFRTLVRVGRMFNCLGFAIELVISWDLTDKSLLAQRHSIRTMFILAGYLYESYLLCESLCADYALEPAFQKIKDLVQSEDKRPKKIVQSIRDGMAFHLDHHDKSTKESLRELNDRYLDFIANPDDTLSTFYFVFADSADIFLLIKKFRRSGQSDDDAYLEIMMLLNKITGDFLGAATIFFDALLQKLNLGRSR